MVKQGRFPAKGSVALIAVSRNPGDMICWYVMAGFKSGACPIVFIAGVTFITVQCCMRTYKFEIHMSVMAQVALCQCDYTRLA